MSGDPYVHQGVPNRWGAQTHPMGYRGDMVRHWAEVAIAQVGDLLTPASVQWSAPARANLEQARARSRS
jgi:hypothetical protein